jgi:hypothetical protein
MNNSDNPQLHKHSVSGSALIADFLGWEKYEDVLTYKFPNLYPIYNINDEENTGWISDQITNAEFHSRWDWLMPVVEKIEIECKFDVNIYGHYNWVMPFRCTILDNRNDVIVYKSNDSKIQCVYDAVVEFIKWWNASLADR